MRLNLQGLPAFARWSAFVIILATDVFIQVMNLIVKALDVKHLQIPQGCEKCLA